MSDSELEALVTPRIREAVRAAIEKVGEREFGSLTGLMKEELRRVLESDNEYIRITLVTIACQINKTHGDAEVVHTSLTECLKGTVMRLPQSRTIPSTEEKRSRAARPEPLSAQRTFGPLYDKKAASILNLTGNTVSMLILGYFLGGIALAPLLGLQGCIGISFSPPAASPCLGSALGLVIGVVGGLAYTVYYFVRRT